MTVLGAQQAAAVLRSQVSRSADIRPDDVDAGAAAFEERLSGPFRGAYKAGAEWLARLGRAPFRG